MKFELHRQDNHRLILEFDDNEDNSIVPIQQQGEGIVLNNIKIDKNSLNKNILKIRYLNGRKINKPFLKYD